MDELADCARHAQKIAWKLGHGQLAVEVYGWALKHAADIPAPALKSLMTMITSEPEWPA